MTLDMTSKKYRIIILIMMVRRAHVWAIYITSVLSIKYLRYLR